MVRYVYTFLSQNILPYIFESKSEVIGSFFLIGTDKRLFAPSKICFTKSESVGELILAILCAHVMLWKAWLIGLGEELCCTKHANHKYTSV